MPSNGKYVVVYGVSFDTGIDSLAQLLEAAKAISVLEQEISLAKQELNAELMHRKREFDCAVQLTSA